MLKRFVGLLLMTSTLTAAGAALAHAADPDTRAKAMVDAMTLDEQIGLLRTQAGFGLLSLGVPLPPSVPETCASRPRRRALGSAGYVPPVERVGMPAQQMSDASLGVGNLGGFLRRGDEATSLPATLALAATFDPDLARAAGEMLGAEAHAKGFNIQLGRRREPDPRAAQRPKLRNMPARIRCWPARSSALRWRASRAATWSPPSSTSPSTPRKPAASCTTPQLDEAALREVRPAGLRDRHRSRPAGRG